MRRRWAGSVIVAALFAAVLAAAPATAAPDDYEPGPCLDENAGGPTPFGDLRAGAFYLEAVEWAFANGLITSAAAFNPDRAVSRAEFAAMLHRSLCLPAPTVEAPFVDLRPGAFYLEAVDWLWSEGYTTGISPTRFGPDRSMTRAEFATFLFRLVGEPAGAPQAGFVDVARGTWYSAAVDWLLLRGLTTGIDRCLFGTDRSITRAEVITFLHRLNTGADSVAHFITLLCGLSAPVAMGQNPATGTWFIAEKGGTLVRWSGGAPADVLTVPVSGGNEQGLLGVAVSPGGSHIYLSYTDTGGTSRVVEYALSGDEVVVGSRRDILSVGQPATNHNGGHVAFGPDGYLYIGFGDGGGGNDTYGNGQNLSTLLGAILRVDPSAPAGGKAYGIPVGNPFAFSPGAAEIWLYGVRNPWRFSFDQDNGNLWVADVGQNSREEFTRMAGGEPGKGANLGWPRWEGWIDWGRPGPDPGAHLGPVHEYGPRGQQSVTGGFVYRGAEIPSLDGVYLWADFFDPTVFGWTDAGGVSNTAIADADGRVPTFGQDADGEVYVLTIDGRLRKLVPSD